MLNRERPAFSLGSVSKLPWEKQKVFITSQNVGYPHGLATCPLCLVPYSSFKLVSAKPTGHSFVWCFPTPLPSCTTLLCSILPRKKFAHQCLKKRKTKEKLRKTNETKRTKKELNLIAHLNFEGWSITLAVP